MTAQRISGVTALVAGLLLVFAVAGPTMTGATGAVSTDPASPWRAGPGMMAGGHMGGGLMGYGNSGPSATAVPGASEVRVQASNFSLTPNEIRLPKGADLNLTLVNPAATGVVHDLTIPTLGIYLVANAGETRTTGLRGLAAGRHDAYCSVPGHAELGMRATVIVE